MSKKKILLIAGCSNAAGYEINGKEFDSKENRAQSFGNLLAKKLYKQPVNIAMGAMSNNAIARSVLSWFNSEYSEELHDVTVLVGWSESCRVDCAYDPPMDYDAPACDWYTEDNKNYININPGQILHENMPEKESTYVHDFQELMAKYPQYIEMLSWLTAMNLQTFLKSKNINYIFCNTMHMFHDQTLIDTYRKFIDESKWYNMMDNDKCFYWYYKNQGYENHQAQYWHHGAEPHRLYADELYAFYVKMFNTLEVAVSK